MKKLYLILAVLLVSLLLAGFGIARWYETLTISGTVNTGTVDAELSVGDCWDSEPDEKDLSSIECTLTADNKTLLVTINNAYPCIDYYCDFDIHNTGSIPIKVWEMVINRGNLPTSATVEITGPELPYQLEPGNMAYWTLHVHLDNDAEEDMDYTFSVSIDAGQWNEPPVTE